MRPVSRISPRGGRRRVPKSPSDVLLAVLKEVVRRGPDAMVDNLDLVIGNCPGVDGRRLLGICLFGIPSRKDCRKAVNKILGKEA